MSIIQTNTWTCEICGKQESTTMETGPWSDPVVTPPRPGWDIQSATDKLACPECTDSRGEG